MLKAAHHPLGVGCSLVFRRPQKRIGSDPVPLTIKREVMGKTVGQPLGCRTERARVACESWNPLLPGRQRCFPLRVRAEEGCQVPGIPGLHILPCGQGLDISFSHSLSPQSLQTAVPQARPPPKPQMTTVLSEPIRPNRQASSRANGIEPLEVLP